MTNRAHKTYRCHRGSRFPENEGIFSLPLSLGTRASASWCQKIRVFTPTSPKSGSFTRFGLAAKTNSKSWVGVSIEMELAVSAGGGGEH